MVWPWVSSAFGMGHRGFTVVEVLWVFFFLPPVGFNLVAKIHLLGFRQGRSATYVYKASHIDAYIIVTLIIPDGLLLHINWK